jgi:hypothetical protein
MADEFAADADAFNRFGRCWLLNADASWDDIPAAERYAALSVLRCGQSVLLLAVEIDDEASVREGLLSLLAEDLMPVGRFGHA